MPDATDKLIAGLVDDLKPAPSMAQGRGMARTVLCLTAGVGGIAWLYGLRADLLSGQPSDMLMLSAGLFLILALASAWAVIDMARPAVGTRREGWGWSALMAGLLPIGALYVAISAMLRGAPSGIDAGGFACTYHGLCCSVLTFAGLTLWLRRGAPMLLGRAGLLVGVASGSAGIFAVALACPQNSLVHIGLWHGLTVVIAGLVGWLFVPRLIRW